MAFMNYMELKANKNYMCDICETVIRKREYYLFARGRDDKRFVQKRYHISCMAICKKLENENEIAEYDPDIRNIRKTLTKRHCKDCRHWTGRVCIIGRDVFTCDMAGLMELEKES